MFNFFRKKTDEEILLREYTEILNDAFRNLYVIDFYSSIPKVSIDGRAGQSQTVSIFFSNANLALSIDKKYLDDKFTFHIFSEGFYVIEINYIEKMFIVMSRSENEIKTIEDMEFNRNTINSTLNQSSVLVLITLLNELKTTNKVHFEVIKNYIFDQIYKFFIDDLSKIKIEKRVAANGFIFCITQ